MKTKGQQFVENTTQHTFLTNEKMYFKCFIVPYKEGEYIISLEFNTSIYVNVYPTKIFNKVLSNGKSYINGYYRSKLFPKYDKRTAIPSFKAMKELVETIKHEIKDLNPNSQSTVDIIKKIIENRSFK